MKRIRWSLLFWFLTTAPAVRLHAATIHEIPTDPGSGISIRLSTPLKFAPHFGFAPVHVVVENQSARNGVWRVDVSSGDAAAFPGLVRGGFEIAVAAGATNESWYFAPLAVPGVVAALVADPNSPVSMPVVFASAPVAPSANGRGNNNAAVAAPTSLRTVLAAGSNLTFSASGAASSATNSIAGSNAPAVRGSAPSADAALKAAATSVLEPTRLLETPWGVTESSSADNGVVTFEQTGSPLALVKPPAESLPPGVVVNLHPSLEAGKIVRTITYVDPAVLAALTAAPTSRVDAYRKALNRNALALWRYGYLRKSSVVQPSVPANFADNGGVVTTTVIETGPASLLVQPLPEALPPDTLAAVVPAPVPPGGVIRKFTVTTLVPLVADDPLSARPFSAVLGAADPGVLLAEVSGPGLARSGWADLSTGLDGEIQPMPPISVPPSVEAVLLQRLAGGNLRAPPTVTVIDPAQMPADWRVWSSMHGVLLRTADYAKLDLERRRALRRWTALGGRLVLATDAEEGGPTEHLGAGVITTLRGALAYISPRAVGGRLQLALPSVSLPVRKDLARDHASIELFGAGERSDTRWLIYVLVGFAILAGPVNLLLLAPPGRRHRILLTMPMIALLGGAVMGTGIVVRVGLGGEGVRTSIVALLPEDGGAAVFQDQVSRTGVLISGRFELPDDTVMAAAPLDVGGTQSGETVLQREAGTASGAWFRSRDYQAYHLRRFVLQAGRVEFTGLAADGAPMVTSSLTTTLSEFSWVDEKDRVWTAAAVEPGRSVTLSPAMDLGWPRLIPGGSKALAGIFAHAAFREPGRWIARAGASDFAPIPTLATIRWRESEILFTGVAGSTTWPKRSTEEFE